MSNIVKFPYSASRRVAARRPRRSKNGTPEERAARAAEAAPAPVISRRSKNGTPEERAAKSPPATVSKVRLRLARRAEAITPLTKEEFAACYNAASRSQQAQLRTMIEALDGEQNRPNPPAA